MIDEAWASSRGATLARSGMTPNLFTIFAATTTKSGGEQSTTYAEGSTVDGRLVDPEQLAREGMVGGAVGTAQVSQARMPLGTVITAKDRLRHNPSGVLLEVTLVPKRSLAYDVRANVVEVVV